MPDDLALQLGDSTYVLQSAHVFRIIVVIILGGLVGFERELRDKPAGFRTIILIAVGSCVFTIVSQVAAQSQSSRVPPPDITRIAAQIVTGVGFLGAGVIMRDRRGVFGLTTAATIWSVAAIGMAVGYGYIFLAVFGTVAILVVLFVFDTIEKIVGDLRDTQTFRFSVAKSPDAVTSVVNMFKASRLRMIRRSWHEEDDLLVFDVVAKGSRANHYKLREKLALGDEFKLRGS